MKEIQLTKGYTAHVVDELYNYLMGFSWYALDDKRGHVYAVTNIRRRDGRYRNILMHRLIMKARKGQLVDHIDGNTLNNTRENLRICSHSENQWNSNLSWGKSKYRGVTWCKHHGKWRARIGFHGEKICIGYFDCEIEAARAYDVKALELRGQFARLNFPGEA
jgi:hypothetical protein